MRNARRLLANRQGAAAIEFAIVAPVFLLVLLTLIAYGIYLSAAHALQQLTADAARTAVAGLSEQERAQLVNNYIALSTLNDPLIDRKKLQVTVATDPTNANQFTVTTEYDASALPIWNLYTFPLPDTKIRRFATIRMGGI
ncbi:MULTISPECIES: TadE/TadG family type IV pilus assembly protein [Rhizobium]|jgi:Flp pilus assembly protein TadG|uniref:Flp pilus assembly protein TadG n=1 Tax=Rhizobium metallidurans TaxID=1265931 RepID=A0A7W6CSZ3_9HYPH|nr:MULTISPECIES: TadE/TadG family type IV pilus assembly protein [Rhizobium]MBB3966600.1 Flp pilus assembly protein TadG [Rhizobium metallidurans]MBO9194694.1 pilus assembly protein [Rhizobium sp. 16-449-1b]